MINTNFNTNAANMNWWTPNSSPNNNQSAGIFGAAPGTNNSTTSADFRNALINVKQTADLMRQSLNHMRGQGRNAEAVFGTTSATASEADVLTLSVDSNRLRRTNPSDFTVEVLQVANDEQNAQFRITRGGITGALQTSSTNEVSLGNGITAQLRETGTTEISMGRDANREQNAFRHMVNSFNGMIDAAREVSGTRNSRLERDLAGIARSSAASLRRVGITMGENGRLTIDEDRMAAAAENGDLERFAGRSGGSSGSGANFMDRLARTADRANRDPESFTRDTAPVGGIDFTARQVSQLHSLLNMGMLFDGTM